MVNKSARIAILFFSVFWLIILPVRADNHIEMADSVEDIRILIDVSGSMKQNDPDNLRTPALDLLIDLLPEDGRAGVWTFGQFVNMLVPWGEVDDEWRELARERSSEIGNLGQRTALGDVLEKSSFDLKYQSNQWPKHFILLTDGMVDISPDAEQNAAERDRILEQILPGFKEAGATIHTISLSDNADSQLLEQLSVQTDGLTAVAKSADELMEFFLKAFDMAVPNEQVPLQGNQFSIDDSVSEYTALMFRDMLAEPLTLTAPNGEVYDKDSEALNVRWQSTDQYDLVTVQNPEAGEWLVNGQVAPNSRVTVVSNLNLVLNPLPTVLYPNQPIEIMTYLNAQEGRVSDDTFLDLMTMNISARGENDPSMVLVADQMDRVEDTFVYDSNRLINQFGRYDVELLLDGQTFQRQIQRTLVFQPNISAEVIPQDDHYLIRVFANNPSMAPDRSILEMMLTPPGETEPMKTMVPWLDKGYWQAQVGPYPEGEALVSLKPKLYMNDRIIEDQPLQDMRLSFPLAMAHGAPMAAEQMTEESMMAEPAMDAMTDQSMVEDSAMTEEPMMEQGMAMSEPEMAEPIMADEAMTEEAMSEEAMTEEAMTEEAMTEEAMTEELMAEEEMMPEPDRPFEKFKIETFDELDPNQVVVVDQSMMQTGRSVEIQGDEWLDDIEEKTVNNDRLDLLSMLFWSLPALFILLVFSLFYRGYAKRRTELASEREEMEKELASLSAVTDPEGMADMAMAGDGDATILRDVLDDDMDDGMPLDDIPELDPAAMDEVVEDDDGDVFDLGDLSDLTDDMEEEQKT